jgi:hypothetical protein
MPYFHHVDPEIGFGTICLSGTVTGTDLIEAVSWFYANEEWVPGSRVLWDGRGVSEFAVSPADLHTAATIIEEAVARFGLDRTAVVAGNLESYMGGSLLAARLGHRTGRGARAFADLAAALEWLVAPAPALLPDIELVNDLD